ncbi:hypothetical protein [Legionella steigerwaltii]|uniref:hypothetical protein n=1 Tax=Legionella steigerwaltii TaxID=460 RepID=UPI001055F59C|nr:hypothetical protein [Legionella steigerwaltii]
MQKKIEILNRYKPVSTIRLIYNRLQILSFDVRTEATKKYGTYFLDRVITPKGLATVIGVHNDHLWFWVDNSTGPSYWDNIVDNIFRPPYNFRESADTNYPVAVQEALNKAVEFSIPFRKLNQSIDLLILLKQLDEHNPEFLVNMLKLALKENPGEMNKQLGSLIQEFETLSVSDLEFVAELAESAQESKEPQLAHFLHDTRMNKVAMIQAITVSNVVSNLQAQIDALEERLKLLKQESQPVLYSKLGALKLNLEESRNNLLKSVETLNAVDSKVIQLKKLSAYKSFHSLLNALIDAYYELQINQNAPADLEHYLAGAARITQFLYDHGHHFFDMEAESASSNDNKQEQSGSLSRLELMYLFLLLSGGAAMSKTLQARVYFQIFEALNIKPSDNENMPETFNLVNFVTNKPDEFVKLYRNFFVIEGPCKQKVEELIAKKHPVLLAELGKLTNYYAAALNASVKQSDAKPGAKQEANYYFKQGINYLLQSLKQGTPQAVEAIDILMTTDKEHQIEGIGEIAKELAAYFTHTRNFAKAHHYLTVALECQDQGSKELQNELHMLQVKLTLLERSGAEQKGALAVLMQKVKEGDRSALALLEELSAHVPAVAFAAVVYWHDEDITKLSSALLEIAAKESPDLVAWYQNRYRVVCQAQKPSLDLILKAVKADFAPAIAEFNRLLDPIYIQDKKDTLLPIISDFEISQHIDPEIFMRILVHYRTAQDLSNETLNQIINSLAHTSFKQPNRYFALLSLGLYDLKHWIGTEEFIAVLYAIKRTGLLTDKNDILLKTIAGLFIDLGAENHSMFYAFLQEFIQSYPELAHALYQNSDAWATLKNNDQIASIVSRVVKDKKGPEEGSALSNLSLFNDKNNKENQTKLSKEEIDMKTDAQAFQKDVDGSATVGDSEERDHVSSPK